MIDSGRVETKAVFNFEAHPFLIVLVLEAIVAVSIGNVVLWVVWNI